MGAGVLLVASKMVGLDWTYNQISVFVGHRTLSLATCQEVGALQSIMRPALEECPGRCSASNSHTHPQKVTPSSSDQEKLTGWKQLILPQESLTRFSETQLLVLHCSFWSCRVIVITQIRGEGSSRNLLPSLQGLVGKKFLQWCYVTWARWLSG